MFEKLSLKYDVLKDKIFSFWGDAEIEKIVCVIKKDGDNNSVGIYYKFNGEYFVIDNITHISKISPTNIDFLVCDIDDISDEIMEIFKSYNQELWTQMLIVIDKEKIDIDYSYDELDDDIVRGNIVWRYKNLGIKPDENHMEYIRNIKPNML